MQSQLIIHDFQTTATVCGGDAVFCLILTLCYIVHVCFDISHVLKTGTISYSKHDDRHNIYSEFTEQCFAEYKAYKEKVSTNATKMQLLLDLV